MKFHLNDIVRVKLTPKGRAIRAAKHALWCAETGMKNLPYLQPEEDADGWSYWSLAELMCEFGEYLHSGGLSPFGGEIEIVEKQQ